ncbi:GNAT family N-acetyltransferase [Streptomyces fuscigenes]|uniref:GNAT family N-acetyltransferase n=1 Tax=Streptomyces fuscigenes TaxID=1528880 RepID=UPI001F246A7A|nr:GNAT family N-acetyltransferase [Streptomyces fuscigenes]MCF3961582.1 GNAT family N-acetyltransferase [Streptomyces fuscigenes]
MTIRPLRDASELDLFRSLPYTLNEEIDADLAAGRRRLPWMWVALREGRVVARAAWWARAAGDEPLLLDVFDLEDPEVPEGFERPEGPGGRGTVDSVPDAVPVSGTAGEASAAARVEVGAALLRAATARLFPGPGGSARLPGCSRFLSPGWRADPAESRAVRERVAALELTGARPLVERLRLQWQPGAGRVPAPSDRLSFRPAGPRAEFVELMAAVLDGTLDAHSRQELAGKAPRRCAEEQYDGELARYASPREWWRTATLPDGEPVGFVVPARNAYGPIIAYIGVLPAHRGAGLVSDILGEGTRVLAAAGAPRIRASTDVGNTPMARAFERAGYATFQRQLDLTWQS